MKRLLQFSSVVLLALAGLSSARAALDLNGDTVPDVWALVYNTGALVMSADPDGDGLTNGQEAAAGTNPFSPAGTVKITNITMDIYGVRLFFPAKAGKRYRAQVSTALGGAWDNVGAALAGVDGELEANPEVPGAAEKFYRVVVSDVDTDGDGVTDWEEMQLGFNPTNSHSGGSGGPDDLTAITGALTQVSTVSVVSIDTVATEPAAGAGVTDTGAFIVSRTGGLRALTVNFNTTGSAATAGSDYTALGVSIAFGLGVKSVTIPVVPLEDAAVESPEAVVVNLAPNAAYSLGTPKSAGVIISDKTASIGTGLNAHYWNHPNETTSAPFFGTSPNFTPTIARIDATVNNNSATAAWPGAPITSGTTSDTFTSRWFGEVQPEFGQIYTFYTTTNNGGRLWVNGQLLINNWIPNVGTERSATIELAAGQRYPVVFEHFNDTGGHVATLSWQSTNQGKQIIPQNRLYSNAAPQILGGLDLFYIKDAPTPPPYQINASGYPTGYAAANLPPGWVLNPTSGAITISTATAGEWDTVISATNAQGTGSAILSIKIVAAGGAITRDVWSGVPGTAISDIPLATNPTNTGTVTALEGPQNAADDYGARIRGYITAPVSGVYKFFLTASNAAELYISDDDEPVNAFKRAEVTSAAGYRDWAHANAGQTPLLQLYAGRRYFVEIRHKAGVGADHVSVGWMQPGQGGNDPAAFVPVSGANVVVPGFVLSPYVPPAPVSGESTLYVTNMSAQGMAVTTGYGSATLTLSADERQAILKYNHAGLTSDVTAKHIHSDAFGSHPQGEIIFDIDVATPEPDGSYVWNIAQTGTFTAADCVTAIKQGLAYINVHTETYLNGEIRGNFRLAAASQTFTPPTAQTWDDPNNAANVESHLNRNGAARFLAQATFGVSGVDVAPADGNPDDIASVQSLGFEGWIDAQFNQPTTYLYPYVFDNRTQTSSSGNTYPASLLFGSWWKTSVTAPDQLRQRLAFALSEILVTSEAGPLDERADAVSDYYDMLLANAFGNFETLLVETTLHPAMGRYLDMLNNDKPNPATGRIPNENYAREILQLFSIGLNRMHPDGSLVLNSKGELVPTYDQDAVIGFSHVFTGWSYNSAQVNPYPTGFGGSSYLLPMTPRPLRHYIGQKRLLNNVIMPGLATYNGQPVDPNADHTLTSGLVNSAPYQNLPRNELDAAHEQIFQHPNTAPFICRQLIQRFVTGTPSRGYLFRVVEAFQDNGSGVRGDMKAVIKAILLDYEARSAVASAAQGFGKQREPVARVTAVARAFPAPGTVPGTYAQNGSRIDVTTVGNHLYGNGQSIFLDFAASTSGDAGQPPDATYTTLTNPATTATTLSVRVKSFEGDIEYTQANGITTFRDTDSGTNDFAYGVGESIHIEYVDGTPTVPASGLDAIEYRSSDEYTLVFANPTTRRATYSQSSGSTTLTVTLTAHGYTAGTQLHLEAVNGSTIPPAVTYVIATVPNANTFTVTTSDTPASTRSGTIFLTPPADLVTATSGSANLCRASDFATRSGPLGVTYSDWSMDTTNTDLNQTPLQSPTVFNFFLPDYQFPGILSNAGLITPEFELTSETSVIRQANTLANGVYNGNITGSSNALGTLGLSSFKSGGRDIVLDFRPWLGSGPGGLPWASNTNLGALVDELNTRLMAGKLPSIGSNNYASTPRVIVNAKQAITDYVQSIPSGVAIESIPGGNPCVVRIPGHGWSTGDTVTISGVTGGTFTPSINGTFQITLVSGSTSRFTVPVNCTSTADINVANATATRALTATDLRDRVRAVIHLLVTSPDFTIQK